MYWKEESTLELLHEMKKLYPEPECALDFGSLFQLIIAVALSAQTTDKQVNLVTPALFKDYPDSASLSKANPENIQEYIKRIGMYKTKAKNIVGIAMMLENEFGGQVPDKLEELIKLPGVGRKTANVVLAVGYKIPAMPVDTHVFRVSNRIGIVAEKDAESTERALMNRLPKESWIDMHHALIWHGRLVCKARKPECEKCGINKLCLYNRQKNENEQSVLEHADM